MGSHRERPGTSSVYRHPRAPSGCFQRSLMIGIGTTGIIATLAGALIRR